MAEGLKGILSDPPFIPEHPPSIIERRIIEWSERADLAQYAYLDGQWRTLTSHDAFHLDERWVHRDDGYIWMEMRVVKHS
jgi:hypothetical protein